MSVLMVLVPVATLLAVVAAAAFLWGTQRGQLDDLVTPALRILGDDEPSCPRSPDSAGQEQGPK